MKPVRVVGPAGDGLNASGTPIVQGAVSPGKALTGGAARAYDRPDSFVECCGQQRLLTVAGVTGDPDLLRVHFGQSAQIIDCAHPRPRPPGNAREVIIRVNVDKLVGVVRGAENGIRGVID